MNLPQLFQIQKVLDERIVREHQLGCRELLQEKVLALRVEIGELANEWRGFKFWSTNQEANRYVYGGLDEIISRPLLEEYVDGLHFVLSIGLELEFDVELPVLAIEPIKWSSITEQFNSLFVADWDVYQFGDGGYFHEGLELFIGLGEMLGFTWDQIETAYMEKNKVNHQRQDDGY
ncbi:TPA: dUTP diphosphatase [Bacillus cereus]